METTGAERHLWRPSPLTITFRVPAKRRRRQGAAQYALVFFTYVGFLIPKTWQRKTNLCCCRFLLGAGKETQDIIYTVTKMRDGQSFSTRMVTASQSGLAIFVLVASFAVRRISSLSKQEMMPIVPSPEHLPTEKQFVGILIESACLTIPII